MTTVKTQIGRRSFLQCTALAGGGMVLGFSMLAGCKKSVAELKALPKEWFNINGYIKIGENGLVTIQSPNPEIGQNVKTSMPMIVAEELDIDWKDVIVEQAPLNTALFQRQLAGGSESIKQSWPALRTAGASAKHMLKSAAAKAWNVPVDEITSDKGILSHKSGKSGGYGEFASAASKIEIPKEVKLKDVKDFKLIGTDIKNVDAKNIITGKPLFGIDTYEEGMLIAMIVHPPAFGQRLKSVDASQVKSMLGIVDVFPIKSYDGKTLKQWCDTSAFDDIVVVVGKTTWEVMQAKKALQPVWENAPQLTYEMEGWGVNQKVVVPGGLENTEQHQAAMATPDSKYVKQVRKDGNPEAIFKTAKTIIERSYSAPFLAHNTMEPMNFFANVTADKAVVTGPIQTPEFMEKSLIGRLGLTADKIEINMTRMGGGFGRRLYGHFLVEAAVISQKLNKPIKLQYTREDDMTNGVYRPAYHAVYKAALDENKNLIAFSVKTGGMGESPLSANRFPAGAVDNYMAHEYVIPTNVSTGAFRAPGSNFIAGAEQSFLDEVAEAMGKDPIQMRIELLEKAKKSPVGKDNDYDAEKYIGVLKQVQEKSNWTTAPKAGIHRGVAAYFCHNTYVAQVVEIEMKDKKPVVQKVIASIDCGIVVNPLAATNLAEGGIIDGIGHGMYSALTVKDGVPDQANFNKYQLIRMGQAPKEIEVHFIKNNNDPTGLGEPLNPPIIGAMANALYNATGKRFYQQPFFGDTKVVG
jgi:isoquinoline 1-oxidoreductase subunit beta